LTAEEGATYNPVPRGGTIRRAALTRRRVTLTPPAGRKAASGGAFAKEAAPSAGEALPEGADGEGKAPAMAEREREILLTAEGLRKLEEELEHLKTKKRREVAERLKVAREFGDLSENAEYEAAKNEQAFVESRIATLENLLRNARIVQDSEVDPHRVNIGTTVTLRDLESGEIVEYTIVGSSEADPLNNRISYECPVGRAVFGQATGSTVEVRLPGGIARYEIVALAR
jgi:transcription elongation factor GreA